MKILLSVLIFVFLCFYASAQKQPMPLSVIEPKQDSILKEADILYKYTAASRKAADKAGKIFGKKVGASEIIVYSKADTLLAVVARENRKEIYEAEFVDDFTQILWDTTSTRLLSEEEQMLFALKDTLIRQSVQEKYAVIPPKGFGVDFTLFPVKTGFHFYALITTEQKQTIPLGNAFIFSSDQDGNVLTFRNIHSKFDSAATVRNGHQVHGIIYSYSFDEPFIHAADICNFRLYGVPAGVETFAIFSKRNKRSTFYDPKTNELRFHW